MRVMELEVQWDSHVISVCVCELIPSRAGGSVPRLKHVLLLLL